MHWVCIDCGARQPERGRCKGCGHDDTLDTRDERVRELMRDVDLRRAMRLEGRCRFVGVIVGMVVVFGLWLVPHYWDYEQLIALPFLADQWILMAAIGFGVMKLLESMLDKKRFPYLTDNLEIVG
jgi:hypothetical protein